MDAGSANPPGKGQQDPRTPAACSSFPGEWADPAEEHPAQTCASSCLIQEVAVPRASVSVPVTQGGYSACVPGGWGGWQGSVQSQGDLSHHLLLLSSTCMCVHVCLVVLRLRSFPSQGCAGRRRSCSTRAPADGDFMPQWCQETTRSIQLHGVRDRGPATLLRGAARSSLNRIIPPTTGLAFARCGQHFLLLS